MATLTHRDIAELEGATPRQIIRHLITRSGLKGREQGATRIVSASVQYAGEDASSKETDWIDVPDDKTQLNYLKELTSVMDLGKDKAEDNAGDQKNRPFDIIIKVPESSKYIQRDVEVIIKGHKTDDSNGQPDN